MHESIRIAWLFSFFISSLTPLPQTLDAYICGATTESACEWDGCCLWLSGDLSCEPLWPTPAGCDATDYPSPQPNPQPSLQPTPKPTFVPTIAVSNNPTFDASEMDTIGPDPTHVPIQAPTKTPIDVYVTISSTQEPTDTPPDSIATSLIVAIGTMATTINSIDDNYKYKTTATNTSEPNVSKSGATGQNGNKKTHLSTALIIVLIISAILLMLVGLLRMCHKKFKFRYDKSRINQNGEIHINIDSKLQMQSLSTNDSPIIYFSGQSDFSAPPSARSRNAAAVATSTDLELAQAQISNNNDIKYKACSNSSTSDISVLPETQTQVINIDNATDANIMKGEIKCTNQNRLERGPNVINDANNQNMDEMDDDNELYVYHNKETDATSGELITTPIIANNQPNVQTSTGTSVTEQLERL